MSTYKLELSWDVRTDNDHYRWRLQNGAVVVALHDNGKPAPEFMDPEEAFIASIASCHMLSFIAAAAKAGYAVDRYIDKPVGALDKTREGRVYMSKLLLSPKAGFAGEQQPSDEEVLRFHRKAQEKCFISNSVLTDVKVEPEL